MTKRIVSGLFILTALGVLGVILAGALTSGEQLIVRFLTAVVVAALGLYVISDLRLQVDNDTATTKGRRTTSRPASIEAPPNSTAAYMATVTRRAEDAAISADAERHLLAQRSVQPSADADDGQKIDVAASPSAEARVASADATPVGSDDPVEHNYSQPARTGSGSPLISEKHRLQKPLDPFEVIPPSGSPSKPKEPAANGTAELPPAVTGFSAEVAPTGGNADLALQAATTAPIPNMEELAALGPRALSEVEDPVSEPKPPGPPSVAPPSTAGDGSVPEGLSVVGPPRFGEIPPRRRRGVRGLFGLTETTAPAGDGQASPDDTSTDQTSAHESDPSTLDRSQVAARPVEFDDDGLPTTTLKGSVLESLQPPGGDAQVTLVLPETPSIDLPEPEHAWPTPPTPERGRRVPPPVRRTESSPAAEVEVDTGTGTADEATSALEVDGDTIDPATVDEDPAPARSIRSGDRTLGIVTGDVPGRTHPAPLPAELRRPQTQVIRAGAADYVDAPLAPIIDLREVHTLNANGSIDTAIKAGELEVISTLIEQGMLSTDGPITDRDVRTMVYVAFTSNELRKLLLAGGSPERPNQGLDLGPVELFDERHHAPTPKTIYTGTPLPALEEPEPPARSQLG